MRCISVVVVISQTHENSVQANLLTENGSCQGSLLNDNSPLFGVRYH